MSRKRKRRPSEPPKKREPLELTIAVAIAPEDADWFMSLAERSDKPLPQVVVSALKYAWGGYSPEEVKGALEEEFA